MKIGLSPLQGQASFDATLAECERAEESGFDSVWVMDHLYQIVGTGPPTDNMLEAYTLLASVAARTSRLNLGALVTGVTYLIFPVARVRLTVAITLICSPLSIFTSKSSAASAAAGAAVRASSPPSGSAQPSYTSQPRAAGALGGGARPADYDQQLYAHRGAARIRHGRLAPRHRSGLYRERAHSGQRRRIDRAR